MQPCFCCLWEKVVRHCKHKQGTWRKLLKDATRFYSYAPWRQCVNAACLFMVPWQQQDSHHAAASWQLTGTGRRAGLPWCSSAGGKPWPLNYLQYAIQTFTTAERTVPHTSDVPGGGGASVGDRLGVHDRNPLLVEQASGISKQQAMRSKAAEGGTSMCLVYLAKIFWNGILLFRITK